MNNLITNYDQIVSFAKEIKVPLHRPRAIIREYLQSFTISMLYAQPQADKLIFVGGTSLRLLRDIDRFSEDLDFDNLGLTVSQVDSLITTVTDRFLKENIAVELVTTHREEKNYYELRFPNLLHDLKLSTNPREKLMIKVDYTSLWKGNKPEIILFSKYGFLERIKTNPLNHLLIQKLCAYVTRKQTQPRDMYDIVWLYAQGGRFDPVFAKENNAADILVKAQEKYQKEGITPTLQSRLQPFLFQENNITKLELLPDVLTALQSSSA